MSTPTQEEFEAWVLADYATHVGKVLLASSVDGYDEHDNWVDIYFETPIRVRVLPGASEKDELLRFYDGCLDPVWPIEPLEDHPNLTGIRNPTVWGISYNLQTGGSQRSGWTREEPQPRPSLRQLLQPLFNRLFRKAGA